MHRLGAPILCCLAWTCGSNGLGTQDTGALPDAASWDLPEVSPADPGTSEANRDEEAVSSDLLLPDRPGPGEEELEDLEPEAVDSPTTEAPLPEVPQDPGPPPGPCASRGGLCSGGGLPCPDQGGSPFPEGNDECLFDDGPLVCCLPPEPLPAGTSCRARGGLCVATPGVCLRTGGIFAPRTEDCPTGPGVLCCLPPSRCPPGDDLECCMGSWTARPQCDRGTWTCLDGQPPIPKGTCLE